MAVGANANPITHGDTTIAIDFVDTCKTADTPSIGAVDLNCQIGKSDGSGCALYATNGTIQTLLSNENYATVDMNGNVCEWTVSAKILDDMKKTRTVRYGDNPFNNNSNAVVFAVAIPESTIQSMICIICGGALFLHKRFML